MKPTLTLLIALSLCACQSPSQPTGAVAELSDMVPDTVAPGRSSNDAQLPGTQLFVNLLYGYHMDSAEMCIVGSRGIIQYRYVPGVNFRVYRDSAAKYMETLATRGVRQYYFKKKFYLGSYAALIYYYPTAQPNKDGMTLFFGDKDFSANATAIFPARDKAAREDMSQTLLSMYRDEDVPEDPSFDQPFTMNVYGTDFSYRARNNGVYVYMTGQRNDGSAQDEKDGFFVEEPVSRSDASLKDRIETMISQMAANTQMLFGNHDFERLQGAKGEAWETHGKLKMLNDEGIFFGAAAGTTKRPLLLLGFLFKDKDKRLKELRAIAASLKLKDDSWFSQMP